MYVKYLLLLILQPVIWSTPIGFSFGKTNEDRPRIINQTLFTSNSVWRPEQVVQELPVAEPTGVYPNFEQRSEEYSINEEIESQEASIQLDEVDFVDSSLHEMFVISPRYVNNIFEIAQENNYVLDENLYTSRPPTPTLNSGATSDVSENDSSQEDEQDEQQSVNNNSGESNSAGSQAKTSTNGASKKPPKIPVDLNEEDTKSLKKLESTGSTKGTSNTLKK